MNCVVRMVLLASVAMAGCGAPEDPVEPEQPTAEIPVEPEDEGAWFISDARPVNRACNEPSYRPGQPDTYPALHSPLYPVIQEKQQKLLAAVQALAPKVTDEDVYDLEADVKLRREISVLSQLVFLMGQDLAPRYLLGICDINSYEMDECALMQRMSGGGLTLTGFERDGDSLRYKAQIGQTTQVTLTIANRDLDGLRQQLYSTTDGNYIGEWARADDGTETFGATDQEGTFSYTEQPDCSGVARAIRTDDGGHPWQIDWNWSSVLKPETFRLQYTECKVNGLNERECHSGSI